VPAVVGVVQSVAGARDAPGGAADASSAVVVGEEPGADVVDPAAQARAAREVERGETAAGHAGAPPVSDPAGEDGAQGRQRGEHGAQLHRRHPRLGRGEGRAHAQQRLEREQQEREQRVQQRAVLEHHEDPAGALVPETLGERTARMGVQHPGGGLHGDPLPGAPHPLAQVDLGPGGGEVGVQPVELAQGLLADQHRGQRHREHVLAPVGLALVDLAGVDAADDASAVGEGQAHVDQRVAGLGGEREVRVRLRVADALGADDGGARGLLDHRELLLERVEGGDLGVLEEPQPALVLGALGEARAATAAIALDPQPLGHAGEVLGALGALALDGTGVDRAGAAAAAARGACGGGRLVGGPRGADGVEAALVLGGELLEDRLHRTGARDLRGDVEEAVHLSRGGGALERSLHLGVEVGGGDRDDPIGPSGLRGQCCLERIVGGRGRRPAQQDDRGDMALVHRVRMSDHPALELASLALGESTPDAEPLVVLEGVLEALGAHLAGDAHLLRLTGGAALLGEERLRVGLRAQGALLPAQLCVVGVLPREVEQGQLRARVVGAAPGEVDQRRLRTCVVGVTPGEVEQGQLCTCVVVDTVLVHGHHSFHCCVDLSRPAEAACGP
jgi:hypothetical protein